MEEPGWKLDAWPGCYTWPNAGQLPGLMWSRVWEDGRIDGRADREELHIASFWYLMHYETLSNAL